MNTETVYVLSVIFLATLVRSTFGFGEALVAVPLLALRIPIATAAPLAVIVSVTVAAIVVIHDWRSIHLRSAGWLILATPPGILLGLWWLKIGPEGITKASLGVLIVAFSGYSLLGRPPMELRSDHRGWLLGCGFLAGVLGGAYGLNGPPLVVYGSMRRWSAQHFRATLQAYFLPASLLTSIGYAAAGLCTRTVARDYLLSLPLVLVAVLLGRVINLRFQGSTFLRYVHVILIITGLLLLAQVARQLT